ncbi:MAG: Rieske 2Fe-2S domain-containing protein [Candidatus Limnocylindrales bacterium]
MRVTFLGQAGLYIEAAGASILCDPWFNPAYFASWFPFPRNDGIDPATIGRPTYLYVSHLHHDHFDPEWLAAHCAKEATVILPAYPLDTLRKELEALGFSRFLETENGVPVCTPEGLTLQVEALVAPTDGPIGDSALIVDDGETRLLNMNDSRPPDPDHLLALGPIDLLFLQFSGAIWYPMVYDLPPRAKPVLAHKKRVAQLARAFRYIELLDPRVSVPSAGPPCFLDDDLFEQNDLHDDPHNIFPAQPVFIDYVREQGRDARLMLPGSVGSLAPGTFVVEHPLPDSEVARIFSDKVAYLRGYQADMRPRLAAERASWTGPRLDLVAELKAWFEPLLAEADLICAGIDDAVVLDLGDERIRIDFRERVVRPQAPGLFDFGYRFTIARELVEWCVRRREPDWVNVLFLSMRFRAWRRGAYNDYVYTWFKCLTEERLQYAEGYYAERGPSAGTFELCGYEVQARCPHMKADLTRFALGEDGVMTCQLHGWQWELASGRCLTSAGHELSARPLGEPEPALATGAPGSSAAPGALGPSGERA